MRQTVGCTNDYILKELDKWLILYYIHQNERPGSESQERFLNTTEIILS